MDRKLTAAVPDDELAQLEAEDAERRFPRINPGIWAEIKSDRAEGKPVTYRMLEGARWVTYRENLRPWATGLQRSPKFGPSSVRIIEVGLSRFSSRSLGVRKPTPLRTITRPRERRAGRASSGRSPPAAGDDPQGDDDPPDVKTPAAKGAAG